MSFPTIVVVSPLPLGRGCLSFVVQAFPVPMNSHKSSLVARPSKLDTFASIMVTLVATCVVHVTIGYLSGIFRRSCIVTMYIRQRLIAISRNLTPCHSNRSRLVAISSWLAHNHNLRTFVVACTVSPPLLLHTGPQHRTSQSDSDSTAHPVDCLL